PAAYDRQGAQSRHGLVLDARQRVAGPKESIRTVARPLQLRRRRTPAREPRRLRHGLTGLAALVAATGAAAAPYTLAPFKDELFAYRNVLRPEYGGDFKLVDYDRPRDLYDRDAVKRQQVKPEYIDLTTGTMQVDRSIKVGNRQADYTAVGKVDGGAKA